MIAGAGVRPPGRDAAGGRFRSQAGGCPGHRPPGHDRHLGGDPGLRPGGAASAGVLRLSGVVPRQPVGLVQAHPAAHTRYQHPHYLQAYPLHAHSNAGGGQAGLPEDRQGKGDQPGPGGVLPPDPQRDFAPHHQPGPGGGRRSDGLLCCGARVFDPRAGFLFCRFHLRPGLYCGATRWPWAA